MDEGEWTVTYLYGGRRHTVGLDSLKDAVEYFNRADKELHVMPEKITGPGGVVLAGDALEEAQNRYLRPEVHGDLDDMPLFGGEEREDG